MCHERKTVLIKAAKNSAKKTKAGAGLGPGLAPHLLLHTGRASRVGPGMATELDGGGGHAPSDPHPSLATLLKGSEIGARRGEYSCFMAEVVSPSLRVPSLVPEWEVCSQLLGFVP